MASNERYFGGGSGGGGDDDGPNILKQADGAYEIRGNQVVLLTGLPLDPDPDFTPGPNVITILAAGNTFTDGKVDVRGSQGVRITAGPPYEISPLTSPPTTDGSTNGIELIVSEAQDITIQRGFFPSGAIQKIEMTPDKITVDAGKGGTVTIKAGLSSITVDAIKGITLQAGANSITLDAAVNPDRPPTGIAIQGKPYVKIN